MTTHTILRRALLMLLMPLCTHPAFALQGARPAPATPHQWRVVWTADPAHEASIVFSTDAPLRGASVWFDDRPPTDAGYRREQTCQREGPYTLHADERDLGEPWFHVARLLDLRPDSEYHFQLACGTERSPALRFRTAPADDRDVSVLSGGDSRSGWSDRLRMNRLIATLAQQDPALLCLLHGGDYVGEGDRFVLWDRWLDHLELATTSDGRVLPIVPVRGNHDWGDLFGEVFDRPGTSRGVWYESRLSAAITLFALDTNVASGGPQLFWLEDRLGTARQRSRWLLCSYHRPIYPAVKDPGLALPFWAPVFEQHDVDLVLESDGHCIKRTVPIRAGRQDPTGVTYIGEGGLGVAQRAPRRDRWYLVDEATSSGHHLQRLDFARDGLRVRVLRLVDAPAPEDAVLSTPIAPGANWRYLAAAEPPANWTEPDFDDSGWPEAPAGFGYGDDDDRTLLADMQGRYSRVYLRHTFAAAALLDDAELSLRIRYDDAFIAWLNGSERLRVGVRDGTGNAASGIALHEAEQVEHFALRDWRHLLRPGRNVLAIEGHNQDVGSSDFTLDPWLALDPLPSTTAPDHQVFDDFTLRPRR